MNKINLFFASCLLAFAQSMSAHASGYSPTDAANNFLLAVANGDTSSFYDSVSSSGETARDFLERMRSQGYDSHHLFAEHASQSHYSYQDGGIGDYSVSLYSIRTGSRVGTMFIECRGDLFHMTIGPWSECNGGRIVIHDSRQ